MRLGLLGYPIRHSRSPELYRRFLGHELTSYELFSFEHKNEIPSLAQFMQLLDGLNITSPYKTHFFDQVELTSNLVRTLGTINTISFHNGVAFGTNTDLIAVEEILKRYRFKYQDLNLLILGDGAMAAMTQIVARSLNISFQVFSRKTHPDLACMDLSLCSGNGQKIIINACSRDFIFNGQVGGKEIFWDFNYDFTPHQQNLPGKVMAYVDGREMLELQALAAIKFWRELRSKLK
jgi:shikimate dehydrogenase